MGYETALEIAARIWGDPDYSTIKMNPDLAAEIAALLKDEADWQTKTKGH